MSSIFEIWRLKNIAKIEPACLCLNTRLTGGIGKLFVSIMNIDVYFLIQQQENSCSPDAVTHAEPMTDT
jgi:hypothetical protein